MNVHDYEKLWLGIALVLIVAFIATITYGAVGAGIAMVDDREDTVDPNALGEDERFGEPRVVETGDGEYEAYVVARQFAFRPDPIEVPANSTVTFYVTSADVIHSFSIVGTNANTMVIPGEVAVMEVEVEEPGTYGVVCNEYCGEGHHIMEGEFVVVPEDEFELEDDGNPSANGEDGTTDGTDTDDGGENE